MSWRRPTASASSPPPDMRERITAKAGEAAGRIDWDVVEAELIERRGVPVQITRGLTRVATNNAAGLEAGPETGPGTSQGNDQVQESPSLPRAFTGLY